MQEEQAFCFTVDLQLLVLDVEFMSQPGIGVGAYAEVIDEEDACALGVKALDHVATYEAATAGNEVCSHRRKDGRLVAR